MYKIIKPASIINKDFESKIIISNDIFSNLSNIIAKYPKSLIITDENIKEKLLGNFSPTNLKLFAKNIKAQKNIAEDLARELANYNYAIAIGSGTINDLVKYAAYIANKPYVVFATAPSMNGYYSENASLIANNLKQSFKAKIALAGYFDLNILANAPIRLIKSGLSDSICSTICRADWLASNYILSSYYSEIPFNLTYELEEKLFKNTDLLVKRDLSMISLLTEILIHSGLAMTFCSGSYPASQGEHMIAHLYEMLDAKNANLLYHGEHIAITSLTMIDIQENFLKLDKFQLKNKNINSTLTNIKIVKEKLDIAVINEILAKKWPSLKAKIKERFRSKAEIKHILKQANIDVLKNKKLLNNKIYRESVNNAFLTRDRFTFLDLNYYFNQNDQ